MQTQAGPTPETKKPSRPIYLDNNATTPLDPSVLAEMKPYLEEEYGNASSKNHSYGWKAEMAVEKARKQVAKLLNCDSKEIIWTSGATESNNMVILGVAYKFLNQKPHIITSSVEHKAVLDTCRATEYFGAEVSILKPNSYGQVEVEALKKAIKPNTKLISLMAANNEVGSINAIRELASIAKAKGIAFHCDAAQAVGKFPIDLSEWNVDFLSLSGHKIYGPKGIGALFIRKGAEDLLHPMLFGGSQEKGIRPGTVNVAGVVGLGAACALCEEHMQSEHKRLQNYQQQIISQVMAASKDVLLNGHPKERLCNNISFSFKNLSADVFTLGLSGLALSSGSACTSGSAKPSHVLMALGRDEATARATIRLGLGRFTHQQEVDVVIKKILSLLEKNKVNSAI